MKYFQNIQPYSSVNMNEFVKHKQNAITSKSLVSQDRVEIRFFSMSMGEDIDKEYYNSETLFIVTEGKVKIVYNEENEVIVNSGEMIALESKIKYGLIALAESKLLNILLN